MVIPAKSKDVSATPAWAQKTVTKTHIIIAMLFLAFCGVLASVGPLCKENCGTQGDYVYNENLHDTVDEKVRSCCRSHASNCGAIIDKYAAYGGTERGRLTLMCMQEMSGE